MAKLTGKERNSLPAKDFAGPKRSFPIPNASHARDALARASDKSPAVKAEVRSAVHSKYPSIGKEVEKRLGAKDKPSFGMAEVGRKSK